MGAGEPAELGPSLRRVYLPYSCQEILLCYQQELYWLCLRVCAIIAFITKLIKVLPAWNYVLGVEVQANRYIPADSIKVQLLLEYLISIVSY